MVLGRTAQVTPQGGPCSGRGARSTLTRAPSQVTTLRGSAVNAAGTARGRALSSSTSDHTPLSFTSNPPTHTHTPHTPHTHPTYTPTHSPHTYTPSTHTSPPPHTHTCPESRRHDLTTPRGGREALHLSPHLSSLLKSLSNRKMTVHSTQRIDTDNSQSLSAFQKEPS